MKEQLAEEKNIPQYLRSRWQKETGFAFPSGHMMFAASWALLAVGLLQPRRQMLTITILLVWAAGVMGSRLLLGMHWPHDLVVAMLTSQALVAVVTWLAQRICGPLTPPAEENREVAQREQEGQRWSIFRIQPLNHQQCAWMPFRRRCENGTLKGYCGKLTIIYLL